MRLNKGDVILFCILLATLMFFATNEFNILAGVSQFDAPAWTLFGVIFGGELLSFAIYKVGMAKYDSQKNIGLAKYDIRNNNQTINEIEQDSNVIDNFQEQKGKHSND